MSSRSQRSRSRRSNERPDHDEIIQSQQLTFEETEEYVVNFITYVLNCLPKKLLITKSELINNVFGGNNKNFQNTFPLAKTRLNEIYGYNLCEINDKSSKGFLCVSIYPVKDVKTLQIEEQKHLALLFLIVPYIYIKNNKLSEKVLCEFLSNFDISFDEEHEFFGNVKKLITETFVKQLYIKKTKTTLELATDDVYTYSLGARSVLEFPQRYLLEMIANLMNKPVQSFVALYKTSN